MSVPGISTRLRGDLTAALKARDSVTVAALRSALTALDNAGAVEAPASLVEGTEHIAGAAAGVGSTDIARRVLTENDVRAILRSQIEEHSRAATEYARIGRDDFAERLQSEAEVLAAYVAGPSDDDAGS
jgi:uncharacterized protein YqeY